MINKTITVTLYTETRVCGVTYEPTDEANYRGIFGVLCDFCAKLKELKIITNYFISTN